MKCPVFLEDAIRFAKKNSPVILLAAAGVSGAATVVLACRSTLKIQEVIDKKNADMDQIAKGLEDETLKDSYSIADARKDKMDVYIRFGVGLVKTYLPAIATAALTVGCVLESYHIQKGRMLAVAAALTTTAESFKDYRERVKEYYGEEAENMVYHGLYPEKVSDVEVGEDGKEHKVKKTANVLKGELGGLYSYRYNVDTSCYCTGDINEDRYDLSMIENNFNDRLLMMTKANKKNYIFLNDVFDKIGFPKTKEGQITGWCYDPSDPNALDKKIDFGVQVVKEPCDSYMNGFKDTIILDFNCDGVLLDLME